MRLYTYENHDGSSRIGIGFSSRPGQIWDQEIFGLSFSDMNELICGMPLDELLAKADIQKAELSAALDLENIRVLAPIPSPKAGHSLSGHQLCGTRGRICPFSQRCFYGQPGEGSLFQQTGS